MDDSGTAVHTMITAANDSASPDDVVEVAPGTYTEDLDFDGKAIMVRGMNDPGSNYLISTCNGLVVRFTSNRLSQSNEAERDGDVKLVASTVEATALTSREQAARTTWAPMEPPTEMGSGLVRSLALLLAAARRRTRLDRPPR